MKTLILSTMAASALLTGLAYADDMAKDKMADHSAQKAEWKECMEKMAAKHDGMSHEKMKKACHEELEKGMHHDDMHKDDSKPK